MSLASSRNSVATLSSSNLLSHQHLQQQFIAKSHDEHNDKTQATSQQELFTKFIMKDFWNNLCIVSLPTFFSAFFWRLMNLYGVGVSHNFYTSLLFTSIYIGISIFSTCFIVDAVRQCFMYQRLSDYGSYTEILMVYYNNWGLRSSFHIAFKFWMACVCWTISYELIAEDHQIYVDKSDTSQILLRALGAGFGAYFGLIIAAEILVTIEYYHGSLVSFTLTKPYKTESLLIQNANQRRKGFYTDTNQRGILGVATKGFFQGFMFSVMADLDLYEYESFESMSGGKVLDALIVGFISCLWFSFGGVFTSLLGFCEKYSMDKKEKRRELNDESLLSDSETYKEGQVDEYYSGSDDEEYLPLL